MSNPTDELASQLPAHFGGVPAVVKLITGETIICVALYDEEQDVYVLDRPLIVTTRPDPDDVTQAIIRFDRWIPLSANIFYSVYADLILTMTVVAQPLVSKYFKWADALYPVQEVEESDTPMEVVQGDTPAEVPLLPPDNSLSADQRELHYMHIMMTHVPKTSPN